MVEEFVSSSIMTVAWVCMLGFFRGKFVTACFALLDDLRRYGATTRHAQTYHLFGLCLRSEDLDVYL